VKRTQGDCLSVDLRPYGIDKAFLLKFPHGDKGLSAEMRTFGFREPMNCRCYTRFIRQTDAVLDIGSNIGFFVLLASHARKITCVEPLSDVIDVLNENIKNNNIADRCEIVHAAAGPRTKLYLEVSPSFNLSRIVGEEGERTTPVDGIPLPDLLERHPSNVIRLDVEGFEYDILYEQIPACVERVSMEFHTRVMGEAKSRRLLTYLKERGFRVAHLVEDVPPRFYPIVWALKDPDVFRFMCYVKDDMTIDDAMDYIFSGRGLKYLYLERATASGAT